MDGVNKILVPIDFSPESAQALRDALALARKTAAQLIALHVIDEKAERDILLTSIAPVDGLPFLLDDSAPVTLDVMLRERALDLRSFVEHEGGRDESVEHSKSRQNRQANQRNQHIYARRSRRPAGTQTATAATHPQFHHSTTCQDCWKTVLPRLIESASSWRPRTTQRLVGFRAVGAD